MKLIVLVVASGRKQLLKRMDESLEGVTAVVEPGTKALLEVARRRMVGTIQCFWVLPKPVAELLSSYCQKLCMEPSGGDLILPDSVDK